MSDEPTNSQLIGDYADAVRALEKALTTPDYPVACARHSAAYTALYTRMLHPTDAPQWRPTYTTGD